MSQHKITIDSRNTRNHVWKCGCGAESSTRFYTWQDAAKNSGEHACVPASAPPAASAPVEHHFTRKAWVAACRGNVDPNKKVWWCEFDKGLRYAPHGSRGCCAVAFDPNTAPVEGAGLREAAKASVTRESLIELISGALSGTYHCTRVWDAWNVGTMTRDDFEPVDSSTTPEEIADAVLAALRAVSGEALSGEVWDKIKLSDVQWMNVVNHKTAWWGLSKDEAVHGAVKLAEAKILENYTALLSKPATPTEETK